ncbi:MAG: type IV pilus modification protein PilV [Candidatus Sedimenticola sp. (ex Thyasira tokunagai)]
MIHREKQPKQIKGFTMIEALISLLVLSVGLLGLAALQTGGIKFNQDAYVRTQATNLAYGAIEWLRINRDDAIAGSYSATYTQAAAYDADDSDTYCTPGSTTTADAIICWRTNIRDNLPSGSLAISAASGTNNNEFTVTISWSDRWRQKDAASTTTSSQSWMIEL